MPYYIEPATVDDLDECYELSKKAGVGLTSFPDDKSILNKILLETQQNISNLKSKMYHRLSGMVLLVMRSADTKKIVGVSGMKYHDHEQYTYDYTYKNQQLYRYVAEDNSVELCAILLDPPLRSKGLGKMLSISRFIFLKTIGQDDTMICSRLRGVFSQTSENTFWTSIVYPLCGISFEEALHYRENGEDDKFSELPECMYCSK